MNTLQHAIDTLGLEGIGNLFDPPISAQAVHKWKIAPIERCVPIEKAMNGEVNRRGLRPDDWHLIWPELVTDDYPAPAEKKAA